MDDREREIEKLIEKALESADLEMLIEKAVARHNSETGKPVPPEAWFLGPKAEHGQIWIDTIDHILRDYIHWRRNYFPEDPIVVDRERLKTHEPWVETLKFEIDNILNKLKAHFPFHSPRYIAHMISEQTFPSVMGYFAGMLYNPNNVTEESAPITTSLELEVGEMVSEMLGYEPKSAWAHISSGGTLANLEALWIARTVQFVPLMVREYCEKHAVRDFEVTSPDGRCAPIVELETATLLNLAPNESIGMIRLLASHLYEELGAGVSEELNSYFAQSRFNVNNEGVGGVLSEVGLRPVFFVSEAAHYSIKKAVNVLGYGENSLESIPVEPHFRMNTEVLREKLFDLPNNTYVGAVIGVAGTTEEGAVDPIHEIDRIRGELASKTNRSFWLHIDAAWGGYVRSVFSGLDVAIDKDHEDLRKAEFEAFRDTISIRESSEVRITELKDGEISDSGEELVMEWADPEVYSAYLAFPKADSITIDPHKLGYIPYPAGVIAFQNRLVTELVIQKAQYITEETGGVKDPHSPPEVTAVGPYIIEGSKPGAVAAACWLSHKTIPLTYEGHGRLIKTSLLNTMKLARYFKLHERLFDTFEIELYGNVDPGILRFTFELIAEPDTNLLCYLCRPMETGPDGRMRPAAGIGLKEINALNRAIYDRATIRNRPGKRKTPYSQEYFVSRTILTHGQYHPASIAGLLERFGFSIYEYEKHGIFLLRSVVMNPWHFVAEKQGKNYLYDFVVHLHRIARETLNRDQGP